MMQKLFQKKILLKKEQRTSPQLLLQMNLKHHQLKKQLLIPSPLQKIIKSAIKMKIAKMKINSIAKTNNVNHIVARRQAVRKGRNAMTILIDVFLPVGYRGIGGGY